MENAAPDGGIIETPPFAVKKPRAKGPPTEWIMVIDSALAFSPPLVGGAGRGGILKFIYFS